MTLTDIKVRITKPSDESFKFMDGQGVHLLINPNGSKCWRLQYRFDGKQKVLALGVYPVVSPGKARRKRDEIKKLVSVGVDPSGKKKAGRVKQSEALTFEAIARDWHITCKREWSDSRGERALKSIEDGLFATIGKRGVFEPNTRDLLAPIRAAEASGRLEVASRLQ